MSREKAKEYLLKIRDNPIRLQIRRYEYLCEQCTAVISDMPKGSMKSTEELYIKLIDLKDRYAKEWNCDVVNAAWMMEKMNNDRQKLLLHNYYIEGRGTLIEAAEGLNLGRDRVKQLHSEALEAFGLILEGVEK